MLGCLGVASAKAQAYALHFGQRQCIFIVYILVIEHEKNAVIAPCFALDEMLCKYAEPHLAEKYDGLGIGAVEPAYRSFHVERTVYLHIIVHPNYAACGCADE